MKLINHNKDNYTYFADCVIRGTITLTQAELDQATKHLFKTRKWVDDRNYATFYKKILREDLKRKTIIKNGYLINIRVSATKGLVEFLGLPNYKLNNYQIEVTA